MKQPIVKQLFDVIQKLADDVGIPKSLSEAGVKREDIPFLAESASTMHVHLVTHVMYP